MTPKEIRKERKGLEGRLALVHRDEKILIAELGALKGLCEHPNAYEVSHMGENCRDCPDCRGCGV